MCQLNEDCPLNEEITLNKELKDFAYYLFALLYDIFFVFRSIFDENFNCDYTFSCKTKFSITIFLNKK